LRLVGGYRRSNFHNWRRLDFLDRRSFSTHSRSQLLHQPGNGLFGHGGRWRHGCGSFDRFRGNRRWRLDRHWLVNFHRLSFDDRRFRSRNDCALHDFHRALDGRFLLREVLVPNLLGELFGDRVGGNADVDTFTTHLFNESLCVEL
jgi:hypothetical protein